MTIHRQTMMQKISRGLQSRYPILYVQGWEEGRIEHMLSVVAASYYSDKHPLRTWTATHGFSEGDQAGDLSLADPVAALQFIGKTKEPGMYLMKDLPALFESNPALQRAVRDLYYQLEDRQTFVFLSHPKLILPETLKKEVFLFEMLLPDEKEILDHVTRYAKSAGSKLSADSLHRLAVAMKGLSFNEIDHLQARIFKDREPDFEMVIGEVQEEKSQLLKKESCLRFYPPQNSLDSIGGLENLKKWITTRRDLFTEEAFEAGIPLPSGILFMGISGCGKSMAAKAVAAAWGLPLVRLDMSLVLSGSFGSPEVAFEQATFVAEEIAPIVLWIDELENAFGYDERGTYSGNINIFSSFLTWLQEKPSKVFVAATANRIEILPAELLRKGRFDQLFFLDLPTRKERIDIFTIHILLNKVDPRKFNLNYLTVATEGWNGAEIEQAVKSARIDAYKDRREFDERDIVNNIINTVPLSQTMGEQIEAMRKWSYNRAVRASTSEPELN